MKLGHMLIGISFVLTACLGIVHADTLVTTSGNSYECVVLSHNDAGYTIRRGYGVLFVPSATISSVSVTPAIALSKPSAPVIKTSAMTNGSVGRFPAWTSVVDYVTKQGWGKDLRQIPATYIDNGVLKNVPYQSYQCASGAYEVNIYGDPDDPACIEIGVYGDRTKDDISKLLIVNAFAAVLPDSVDVAIARAANLKKDLIVRDGLTTEITPPEAPDAYGGWWISVYDETKLEKVRATKAELDQVTVAKPQPSVSPVARAAAVVNVPMPQPVIDPVANANAPNDSDWTAGDYARQSPRASTSSAAYGARVYVRGYYRKNGTYVHSYTRRR